MADKFSENGDTTGFRPQTLKVEPPYIIHFDFRGEGVKVKSEIRELIPAKLERGRY